MSTQKGNAMIVILLLAVILIAGGAGAFWYVNQSKQAPVVQTTKAFPSPKSDLEKEVDAIQLTEVEEDFKDVDTDIKSL